VRAVRALIRRISEVKAIGQHVVSGMLMCILGNGKSIFTGQLNPRRKILQPMKLLLWIFSLLVLLGGTEFLQGAEAVRNEQRTPPADNKVPSPTPYASVSQDGNSRVWERTVYELDSSGQAAPKQHRVTRRLPIHKVAIRLSSIIGGQSASAII